MIPHWEDFFEQESSVTNRIIGTLVAKYPEMQLVPEPERVFRMFRLLPMERVRVVIMGQDPYPGLCPMTRIPYASGVAFFPDERTRKVPKTLVEMQTELHRDLGARATIGVREFQSWINQGVFLTNLALTTAMAHRAHLIDHKVLWEQFSRDFVKILSQRGRVVFCLVGTEAWRMKEEIDASKCGVVQVYHPVSRSSDKAFSGCQMYSKINAELQRQGLTEIHWTLP